MKIKASQAITKLIKLGIKTKALSGYIYIDDNSDPCRIRIYPKLNINQYYEIEESSIVDLIESSERDERTTILVRDDVDVSVVTKRTASAFDAGRNNSVLTPTRSKLPSFLDRLWLYQLLNNSAFLEMYLGTESIPGTGQTGSPNDDL